MKKLMEKMRNQSIKKKLSTMAKTMIAFMIVLGLGAMFGAWELNHQTNVLHDDWIYANNLIAEIDYLTSEVRLKQYAHVISSSTVEFNQHEAEIEELKAQIDAKIAEYEKTIDSETDREYFEAAKAAWTTYTNVTGDSFLKLSRYMELQKANAIMLGEGFEAFSEFQVNFDKLLEDFWKNNVRA